MLWIQFGTGMEMPIFLSPEFPFLGEGRTSQTAVFRLQRELGSAGVGQTLPGAQCETCEGDVEEQSRSNLGFVC